MKSGELFLRASAVLSEDKGQEAYNLVAVPVGVGYFTPHGSGRVFE